MQFAADNGCSSVVMNVQIPASISAGRFTVAMRRYQPTKDTQPVLCAAFVSLIYGVVDELALLK